MARWGGMPKLFLAFIWFWFEYKTVVPKGFVRVLGKLAEIRDSGIPIYFFRRKSWMDDYFQKELNIPVYYDNQEYTLEIKPFDRPRRRKRSRRYGINAWKKVFTNRFLNGFLVGTSRYWSSFGAIPIRKKTS
jgi:hypothetical protein